MNDRHFQYYELFRFESKVYAANYVLLEIGKHGRDFSINFYYCFIITNFNLKVH